MGKRILIFGDSIAWGASDAEGGWAYRLKRYSDNLLLSGHVEYGEEIDVYPLGVSGDTSVDLLRRMEAEIVARIPEENELVIMIAVGINDSLVTIETGQNAVTVKQFEENLRACVKLAQQYCKQVILVGLTPVDEAAVNPMVWDLTRGYANAQVRRYDEVVREVAGEFGLETIPLYELFEEVGTHELLEDGLHPNTKGHGLMYKKILSQLKQAAVIRE